MVCTEWTVRETSTEPIIFVLFAGTDRYSLQGYTALEMRLVPHAGGDTLTFTPTDDELAITNSPEGEVTFYPKTDTLLFSAIAYDVYFWVTDGPGNKISFPHNSSFVLQIIDNL